ncbi:hypothetical protein ACXWTF_12745 [Thiomicrolovo sp. ZZH C-3]
MVDIDQIVPGLEEKYGEALTAREKEIVAGLYGDFGVEREALKDMYVEMYAYRINEPEAAMQQFVDRVDKGEIRSKKTYAQFKELLAQE